MEDKNIKEFCFVHFNDVYNISNGKVDPVGGASRFVKLVRKLKYENENCLILFSGDIYSPSESKNLKYQQIVSSIFRGKQMVPVIDALEIDATVDFGEEHLLHLINMGKKPFPWLLSNLLNSKTNNSYAPGVEYFIKELNKIKIGFMGLIEYDWLTTIPTIKKENFIFIDFIVKAKELSKYFKEIGCDFIIALTHMRTYNDKILAEAVPEIDLVLGGHDHMPVLEITNKNAIIKSGSDFKNLTFNKIKVFKNLGEDEKTNLSRGNYVSDNKENCRLFFDKKDYGFYLENELHYITKNLEEDVETKEIIRSYQEIIKEEFKTKIGHIYKPVDARFDIVRSTSSSIGNFICDVTRIFSNTEVCLMNSGTLRLDAVMEQGVLTYGGLKRLLPGEFFVNRIYATGYKIWQCLENGVSRYPALEGRFPMVSGIDFTFDPAKEKYKRIDQENILINGEKINMARTYSVSLREYIHQGYDGYDTLIECPYITDQDDTIMLIEIMHQFFKLVSKLPKKIKRREEAQKEIYFGHDENLKIIDYINELTVEIEGELSLNIDLQSRIHIDS